MAQQIERHNVPRWRLKPMLCHRAVSKGHIPMDICLVTASVSFSWCVICCCCLKVTIASVVLVYCMSCYWWVCLSASLTVTYDVFTVMLYCTSHPLSLCLAVCTWWTECHNKYKIWIKNTKILLIPRVTDDAVLNLRLKDRGHIAPRKVT